MAFVITHPEGPATAACHMDGLGWTLAAQNLAAAGATTGLPPAAADEVSAPTATQLSAHAARYQAAGAQAMAVHELFVATLGTSAGSCAAAEAADAIAAG
jgi:PE family